MASHKKHRRSGSVTTTPSDELSQLLRPITHEARQEDTLTKIVKVADHVSDFKEKVEEDLRRFDPQHQARRALTLTGAVARKKLIAPKHRAQLNALTAQMQYVNPNTVITCVKRRMRREVMFALDLARKGGRGGGKRKRTERSSIKC